MDFSVIIASSRLDVSECIKSVLDNKTEASFEVIVALDPGSKIELPLNDERVQAIVSSTTNPAAKRNLAARKAIGRNLAFIDDDAVAPKDWLERARICFESDEALAGVGGPNLKPNDMGLAEKLTDIILSSEIGSGGSAYKSDKDEPHEAKTGELHLVNMFVNRELLLTLGGFNEALGYGSEDTEFVHVAKRVNNAKFVFDPSLTVIHRRRPFGLALFKQRFKLRLNNGRLLMIKPSMYSRNRMLIGGLAGAFLTLLLAIFHPNLLAIPVLGYASLLGLFTLRSARKAGVLLTPLLPVALLMHHTVYLAGILAGFFKVMFDSDYSAIRSRRRLH